MRNRYFWNSAEWIRVALAQNPDGQNVRLKVVYDTFQNYAVPPHASAQNGRTYAYWPIEHKLGHTRAGTRCKADLYLVTHGEDYHSKVILPSYQDPPAAPNSVVYDGALILIVKLQVNLPATITVDEDRKKILQGLTAAAAKLNGKFVLKSKARTGTDQAWEFKRCHLFFSPRYCVSDAADANTILTNLPKHFDLTIGPNTTANTVSNWVAADQKPEIMSNANWTSATSGQTFTNKATIDTAVSAYHGLDAIDLESRITKLGEIIGLITYPETVAEIKTRAAWESSSNIPDGKGVRRRVSASLLNIDAAVGEYEGIDKAKFDDRIAKLDSIRQLCDSYTTEHKAMNRLLHPQARDRLPMVDAFKTEVEAKLNELRTLRPRWLLKTQATDRKGYLERQRDSTHLEIKYANGSTADQRKTRIQDEFAKRFLGFLGVGKTVSTVTTADLEKFFGKTAANQIATLNLTDASITAA
jgi:hypothetical protein